MNELILKVKVRDLDIEVGKILWTIGPGEISYDIPKDCSIDEENSIHLVGLQYFDFSMFVILIEVSNPSYGANFFLVDPQKLNLTNGGIAYLPEIESFKEFNRLAAKYIDGEI